MRHLIAILVVLGTSGGLLGQYLFPNPIFQFLGEQAREMGISQRTTFPYDGLGQSFLLESQHSLFSRAVGVGLSPKPLRPNGFGRIGLIDNRYNHRWASLSGSHLGHLDAAGSLPHRILGVQHDLTVNYQQLQTEKDRDGDGFRDLPQYRRFFIRNMIRTNLGNDWHAALGGAYHGLRSEGGQVDYQRRHHFPDGPKYGFGDETDYGELFFHTARHFGSNADQKVSFHSSLIDLRRERWFGARLGLETEQRFASTLAYEKIGLGQQIHVGLQYQYHHLEEQLENTSLSRKPSFVALSGHYQRLLRGPFILKAGFSVDYLLSGRWMVLPNLRSDYQLGENWQFGVFAGRDYRHPSTIASYPSLWLSQRQLDMEEIGVDDILYFGVAARGSDLRLWNWRGQFKLGYQFREYLNKVVIDPWTTPGELVSVYDSEGDAYQHRLLSSFTLSTSGRWRVGAHYLFALAQQDTRSGRREILYTPRHSGLMSIAYTNLRYRRTSYEARLDYVLRSPMQLPLEGQESPWTHNINLHLSSKLPVWRGDSKELHLFIGANNLLNQRQVLPFEGSDEPFAATFDGAGTWNNAGGIQTYAGLKVSW